MRDPIYKPKGAALEYANYALNIYTGCPHGCSYCYVPAVLRKSKAEFHSDVRPRDGIIEAVETQLAKGKIKDQLIHLCFTCDPYPKGYDSTTTREIIKLIKASGNHVQILTKNPIDRDWDLLDANDWFGVTVTAYAYEKDEPNTCLPLMRLVSLAHAKRAGIRTWVSVEPVLSVSNAYHLIKSKAMNTCYDRISFGKFTSDTRSTR